ncbi:hypothetical protein OMP44_14750 [Pseudomonas sp. CBMAI 2609]|uniref:Uncharacterized protein n=1 Tax=Pseudomonas flavocrustae TaxID=2991719 RepID=A0ABT6II66_9PSED|nr:hypothetical protein [Pseudomonas sp. CBMAI 2609]MDH4764149.1 hypothetical protein [Pseudomonas sp. CBMAI 2609]
MTTPTLSYRFGESVGTALREIIRSVRNAQAQARAARPSIAPAERRVVEFPQPIVSAAVLEEMDHVPAFVRRNAIDLTLGSSKTPRKPSLKSPSASASRANPRLPPLSLSPSSRQHPARCVRAPWTS